MRDQEADCYLVKIRPVARVVGLHECTRDSRGERQGNLISTRGALSKCHVRKLAHNFLPVPLTHLDLARGRAPTTRSRCKLDSQ